VAEIKKWPGNAGHAQRASRLGAEETADEAAHQAEHAADGAAQRA
jgi:hypothetical protein